MKRFLLAWFVPFFGVGWLIFESSGDASDSNTWSLAFETITWIVLIALVRLPSCDRVMEDQYDRVKTAIQTHRVFIAIALVPVAFLLPFHGWLLAWGGGQWAGVAFRAALLLYVASLLLALISRWYAGESSRIGRLTRLVFAAALGLAWIAATRSLHVADRLADHLEWTRLFRDGRPTAYWALVWLPVLIVTVWLVSTLLVNLRVGRLFSRPTQTVARATARLAVRAGPSDPDSESEAVRNELIEQWTRTENTPGDPWRAAALLASLFAVAASGGLVLVASLLIQAERHVSDSAEIAQRGAAVKLPDFTGLSQDQRWAQLASIYAPVLRISSDEQWREEGVDEFLPTATLVPNVGKDKQPEKCLAVGAWLGRDTFDAQKPCGDLRRIPADLPDPASTKWSVFRAGAVYPHVKLVNQGASETGTAEREDTRLVIEYWLFYPYDRWDVPKSALGHLKQEHGGDWEVVAVGLGSDNQPRFVAYSAHCGGLWRAWKDAPVVSLGEDPVIVTSATPPPEESVIRVGLSATASHPLVVVARGSHANYPTTGSREPDWGSCPFKEHTSKPVQLLSFAASIHETTPERGKFQIPSVADPDFADKHVGTLPWAWGTSEEITLGGLLVTGPTTHGPTSPANTHEHPIWSTPLATIFGGPHWGKDTVPTAAKTLG